MGEIAEAMLDGTLCEGCGEYMGVGDGYPQRCADCAERHVCSNPFPCPACARSFRTRQAVVDHARDKHQLEPDPARVIGREGGA